MKLTRLTYIALAMMLATCAPAFCQQDLTIGLAGPMTGGDATFGQQMKRGAEQAVADLNAAGGVLGRKLRLEIGDDACDPRQARSVAEKFGAMKVPLVVGHYCSSTSVTASDAYAESGVLQITPASTTPLLTDRGLWNTFRVCGRDDQQGTLIASYIVRNFKTKNIAIVHDKGTYGKGIADQVKATLNQAGVKEKLFDAINKGDKDFGALVAKLKRDKIDVIFVGAYHQDIGLIVRQMRDQGLKAVMMSGDSIVDREYVAIAGPAADGTLFTYGPDPRKRPTAATIVKKFKDTGVDPEGYTLYTYAAFQVWAQAAAKAGTTDPKKVAETMRAGRWETVVGEISYDKKGDITQTGWALYRWNKNGTYDQL